MELVSETNTTANGKIQSVYTVQKMYIEKVKELFADPVLSQDFTEFHMSQVYFLLERSKERLEFLNQALLRKMIINDTVEMEVQQAVLDLENNIALLEKKKATYDSMIEKANKNVGTSNLRTYFLDNISLFESLLKDILVVYKIPGNNNYYGGTIREILKNLEKNWGSEYLKQQLSMSKNNCQSILNEIQQNLANLNEFNHFSVEINDLLNVEVSVKSLLKMCDIVLSHVEK